MHFISSVTLCSSKNYLYLPHGRDFSLYPPPLWKFQSSFIHLLKFLGLWEPPTPRNFQSLLRGEYGYFLELVRCTWLDLSVLNSFCDTSNQKYSPTVFLSITAPWESIFFRRTISQIGSCGVKYYLLSYKFSEMMQGCHKGLGGFSSATMSMSSGYSYWKQKESRAKRTSSCTIPLLLIKNYSSSLNGLWVNSP